MWDRCGCFHLVFRMPCQKWIGERKRKENKTIFAKIESPWFFGWLFVVVHQLLPHCCCCCCCCHCYCWCLWWLRLQFRLIAEEMSTHDYSLSRKRTVCVCDHAWMSSIWHERTLPCIFLPGLASLFSKASIDGWSLLFTWMLFSSFRLPCIKDYYYYLRG